MLVAIETYRCGECSAAVELDLRFESFVVRRRAGKAVVRTLTGREIHRCGGVPDPVADIVLTTGPLPVDTGLASATPA
jgi:hypothetical protein